MYASHVFVAPICARADHRASLTVKIIEVGDGTDNPGQRHGQSRVTVRIFDSTVPIIELTVPIIELTVLIIELTVPIIEFTVRIIELTV